MFTAAEHSLRREKNACCKLKKSSPSAFAAGPKMMLVPFEIFSYKVFSINAGQSRALSDLYLFGFLGSKTAGLRFHPRILEKYRNFLGLWENNRSKVNSVHGRFRDDTLLYLLIGYYVTIIC